jgi:hypothetical protein
LIFILDAQLSLNTSVEHLLLSRNAFIFSKLTIFTKAKIKAKVGSGVTQ